MSAEGRVLSRVLIFAAVTLLPSCERTSERAGRPAVDREAAGSISVASIFAPPGPDGVLLRQAAWRPDGSAIAFLLPARTDSLTGDEVLELWLADPATGERRRLLGAEELLGGARQTFSEAEEALRERLRLSALGITSYDWSPDGERLLIPLSGDLYEYVVGAGSARRLTETGAAEFDPHYSPDGSRVAFVREDDLYVLDLATRVERRLTAGANDTLRHAVAEFIAQEELGRHRGFWWGPDGQRIAYTQVDEGRVPVFALVDYREPYGGLTRQRYPRPGDPNATVRLFVVGADGGSAVRMEIPSGPDWYLARVAWHPNENDLVVQMMPRDQDSIRVLLVDAATGRSRLFFIEEEEGDEWVDLHDDLTWLPDGDFLWTSARSGYRHIYRYGSDGTVRHPVTAGDWPVDAIEAVDPEGGWVYFTAQADGPFERHLYRARLDGSSAGPAREGVTEPSAAVHERLSREPGRHDPTFAPDNRRYLDTFSTAVRPTSVAVHDAATGERTGWIEENRASIADEANLVEPEFLWVRPRASDGAARPDSLPAMILRPPGFDPDRQYPVLVYTYGGPGAQVAVNGWLSRGRGLWHQLMAGRGFIVWSCDGRGSGARGKAWIETVYRRLGSLETEDQAACARGLWELEPAADRARMGIWGWSFGGYMAANSLAREGDVWAAAAAVAPVTDWRDYDTAYTERYMETPAENPSGYDETAPVRFADRMTDPFFLAYGLTDDNVHPVHSVRLVDALIAAGHPPEVHVYPGRGHAIGDPPARIALFEALTNFFVRTLQPMSSGP
ncbi:MAG TPA: DPP IV N-terminal domain-containing protein [Gemmatimonadota bacterium]|nr:DPP IV N-terminal domain-containing protein [Gemmatimonadota bacterium]